MEKKHIYFLKAFKWVELGYSHSKKSEGEILLFSFLITMPLHPGERGG